MVLIDRMIPKNLDLLLYLAMKSLFPFFHSSCPPQFPMGFSVAASVRVGNALGAGNTEQAKLSSKVSLICACMNQICSLTNLYRSVPIREAMAILLQRRCSSDLLNMLSFLCPIQSFSHVSSARVLACPRMLLVTFSPLKSKCRFVFSYIRNNN